jgi:hypothetical protein
MRFYRLLDFLSYYRLLAHKLDHLRENMSKISLSLNLKQQLSQFVIKLSLLPGVTTPNIFLVAHKYLDEHVVIIVVVFCHGHPAGNYEASSTTQLHRLVLPIPSTQRASSARLLHILASGSLHHLSSLLIDSFLLSFPFLGFFDLHTKKKLTKHKFLHGLLRHFSH